MSRKIPESLKRLREICLALPEAEEKLFGGHTTPTFRVRDKIFAMYTDNHHDDGRVAMWCKAPPGAQEVLVSGDPERYFKPPYVGPKGWIGIMLEIDPDWKLIADLVTDSYRMTAPKRLVKELESVV